MSVGERVSDLVAEPVGGVAQGVTGGAKIGGTLLGGLGFALGAVAAGVIGLMVASTWALGTLAMIATVGAAAVVGGLALGALALVAGGLSGGLWGGAAGLVVGGLKGIKKFFSGRSEDVPVRDTQLETIRQENIAMRQENDSMRKQFEREQAITAMGGNPDARNDNVQRYAPVAGQSPGLTPPPMKG